MIYNNTFKNTNGYQASILHTNGCADELCVVFTPTHRNTYLHTPITTEYVCLVWHGNPEVVTEKAKQS